MISARLWGARPSSAAISPLRGDCEKSRTSRASSVSKSSAGFKSIKSLTPAGSSGKTLESVSASGPDRPKWVSISSPWSLKIFLPLASAVRRTFLREIPIAPRGQDSSVSIGTSAGSGAWITWPASSAKRRPSPVEPVEG